MQRRNTKTNTEKSKEKHKYRGQRWRKSEGRKEGLEVRRRGTEEWVRPLCRLYFLTLEILS